MHADTARSAGPFVIAAMIAKRYEHIRNLKSVFRPMELLFRAAPAENAAGAQRVVVNIRFGIALSRRRPPDGSIPKSAIWSSALAS